MLADRAVLVLVDKQPFIAGGEDVVEMPSRDKPRRRVADGFVVRPGAVHDPGIVPRPLRERGDQPDRKAIQCRGAVSGRPHPRLFQAAAERGDASVGMGQHQDGFWTVMPRERISDELGLAAASRCDHQPTPYCA